MRESRSPALAVAWGGTIVFAASLLWFCYCYLVRFDRLPASAGTGRTTASAIFYDTMLFSVFALHHSVLARARAKRWIERVVPSHLERSCYTWIASLLFIGVCTWWLPVPGLLYRLNGAWRALGYAVQGFGAMLTIRTSRALDVLDLAGVRQVRAPSAAGSPQHVPLKTTGVYGFVRHPLYFAWALMVFGTPDMTATRALFACISTAYLAIAIPWEERALVEMFGKEYEAYRGKVRWRMVPWVY